MPKTVCYADMKGLKDEDKKLLNLLQEDDACVPRVTKLAHKLGLPTSTVKTKIDRLVKKGYIKGFPAVLNPEKVGKGFTVFVLAHVPMAPDIDIVEDIPKKLAKLDEVTEIYYISGEWDYLLKIRARDRDDYIRIIKKVVRILGERGGRGTGIVGYRAVKETQKIRVG